MSQNVVSHSFFVIAQLIFESFAPREPLPRISCMKLVTVQICTLSVFERCDPVGIS